MPRQHRILNARGKKTESAGLSHSNRQREFLMKFGLISMILLSGSPVFARVDLTEDQLATVRSGETIVGSESLEGFHQGNVWAAVWIPAPVESIWEVMLDCAGAPDFVPGLKSCQIIEEGTKTDIRRHRIDLGFLLPDVDYVFQASYRPYREIHFKRISGGLKEMEGLWELQDDPDTDGTLVLYSVFIDPGFLVPQWMVRGMTRKNLPGLLEALRERVLSQAYQSGP